MTSPIDLQLDADGDLALGPDGDMVMTDDLTQMLQVELSFVQGEWFLDLDAGVPWLSQILGRRHPNLEHVRSALRTAILAVEGVRSLERLVLDHDTLARTLAVRFVANGIAGSVEIAPP